MTKMTEPLRPNITIWLDDVLIAASSEQELLSLLDQFLGLCVQHNLLLSPKKSELFLREVRFCGRLISAEGVKLDPKNHAALLNMSTPKIGGELQRFICALNWMRTSLPDFAILVAPRLEMLEEVYC